MEGKQLTVASDMAVYLATVPARDPIKFSDVSVCMYICLFGVRSCTVRGVSGCPRSSSYVR